MPERNLEQLLGGYATGTLTEEERRALYEAALQDQALFDAMGDEQAFKELLDDPVHRRRLLEALKKNGLDSGTSWWAPVVQSLRRPGTLAIAGSIAVALLAVVFTVRLFEQVGPPEDQEKDLFLSRSLAPSEPELPSATAEPPGLPPASNRPDIQQSGAPKKEPGLRTRPTAPKSPAKEAAKSPALRSRPQPEGKASAPMAPSPSPPPEEPSGLLSAESYLQGFGRARDLFYAEVPAVTAATRRPEERLEGESSPGRMRAEKRDLSDEAVTDKPVPEPLKGLSAKVGAGEQAPRLPLGIRYSLLKRGPENRLSEVDPGGVYRSDDELRVTVEANQDGYLYIFKQLPSGDWTILFPSPLEGFSPGILGRTRYEVPPTGSLDLQEVRRPTRFLIAFSREPVLALERLLSTAPVTASSMERFFVEHPGQPLLLDKVQPRREDPGGEQATYVGQADLASQILIYEQVFSRP